MTSDSARPTCCVIGAGAAGLAALHEIRSQGFDVRCFEATDRVGGHWNTDYDALHLITGRDVTGYADQPMPSSYPLFPSRTQVVDYLQRFARTNGLDPVIEFETTVTSAEPIEAPCPVGSAGWQVTTSRGERCTFDTVVVANGHLWDKRLPAVAAQFTGTAFHSSQYHSVADIAGQRVLVIGAGNSGCDLAVDAAQARLTVAISMRSGRIFQPKTFYGRSRAEVDQLRDLPPDEQDIVTRQLIRVVLGTWADYPGMPEPDYTRLSDGPPVVNTLMPYWIQHGRIEVVPEVVGFNGTTARFADGTTAQYDTALWATGFNVRLPFLDRELLRWDRGVPLRLAGGVVPVGPANLYFIGLAAPRGPQIAIYPDQARLVTRMLSLPHRGPASLNVQRLLLELEQPESRIDVLRPGWLASMARGHDVLDRLAD